MLDNHLIVKTNPVAKKENIVFYKDYRITILLPRLFRIEKSQNKIFRDSATQAIWYRNTDIQKYTVTFKDDEAIIDTFEVKLHIKDKRKDCYVEIDNKNVLIDNKGNLKGTNRTLDRFNGKYLSEEFKDGHYYNPHKIIELDDGVCSKNGVAYISDSESLSLNNNGMIDPIKGDGIDDYVFAYGFNYKEAVNALYLITGMPPLVPRYALGNWWSRYHKYSDSEYLSVIQKYEDEEIPLSVAALDMDWHYSYDDEFEKIFKIKEKGLSSDQYIGEQRPIGWTGYSWNKELFPNPQDFLKKIKRKNLKITLNLHPATGFRFFEDCYNDIRKALKLKDDNKVIPFDFSSTEFINAYFKYAHKPLEKEGVDFFWIDWQQGTKSKIDGLDPLWALNHFHFLDNALNNKHPLILSRYSKIGSHRYPLGFSGDTFITWDTLSYLVEFTLTSTNIGYTWWSHDIGGHMKGIKDNDLYIRMLEFGVFSPINRLHCCDLDVVDKSPWSYSENEYTAINFLKLRHKLIPFLYSANYKTHKYGVALIEPVYYYHHGENAYRYKNAYFFGESLFVAPIVTKSRAGYGSVKTWIPKGHYTDIFTGFEYNIYGEGEIKTLYRDIRYIPVLAKDGTILPIDLKVKNGCDNPTHLLFKVFKGNGNYTLYEDDDNSNKAFTYLSSTYKEEKNECIQTLNIKSNDTFSLINKNRILRIEFSNSTKANNVVFKVNGKDSEYSVIYSEKTTIEFAFSKDNIYDIEIRYNKYSNLDSLINFAKTIFTEAPGDNEHKNAVYMDLKESKDLETFIEKFNKSELDLITKKRIEELL